MAYFHYIDVSADGKITRGWSTGRNSGVVGQTLLTDKGGYEFSILGVENPTLVTDDGIYLYTYDGKKAKKRTDKDITKERKEREDAAATAEKAARIAELKHLLSDSDYAVIKIAEGAATKEEYAELIAQRERWREEIRDLEVSVK